MAIYRISDPYLYEDRKAMEQMYRQRLEHEKLMMRREMEAQQNFMLNQTNQIGTFGEEIFGKQQEVQAAPKTNNKLLLLL